MDRKNLGVMPVLYPQPVLIIGTYDENGVPDAMNAAWGGTSDTNEIVISLSADHKTVKNFLRTGAFTVSAGTRAQVIGCDYVGIISGNDVPDKFARAGFTAVRSEKVDAPIINELPVCLECRVKRFEDGLLFGEIVNVSAAADVLTDGKVDMSKVGPICFDPFTHAYHAIGEKVGQAWESGQALV